MQFNRNYLYGENVHYEGGDNNIFDLNTPTDEDPDYWMTVWVDFYGVNSGPFVAGDIIECHTPQELGPIDVTGYQVSFGPVVSDTPTIVPDSVYAQQVDVADGLPVYALACRDTNGSGHIIVMGDSLPIIGHDNGEGNKEFQFMPSEFPVFENESLDQSSITWTERSGYNLIGWPTKTATNRLQHISYSQEDQGYVASYGQLVDGVQVWPWSQLVSGDLSPQRF